jgi:trehalose 6-phosphate synthase
MKLPWRKTLLLSLLQYDLVGFQTLNDRDNFLHCIRKLIRDARFNGYGRVKEIYLAGRKTKAGYFPIGIDYTEFATQAVDPKVIEQVYALRKDLGTCQIIFVWIVWIIPKVSYVNWKLSGMP